MSGRSISVILGKGWGFSGIEPSPTLWPLWSTLELSWWLWVCHIICSCVITNIYRVSRCSGSLIHHLGLIWFYSVYVMSLGYVILLKIVPCPLPSCFKNTTPNTWCKKLTPLKRPWCWERLKAGGEEDDRGWDGWMASPTQWTWVWVNSGSWWWTRRSGVLQCMRLQRIGHNWVTELNWTEPPTHPFVFCWGWYLRWF